jgi:hypothetical protein
MQNPASADKRLRVGKKPAEDKLFYGRRFCESRWRKDEAQTICDNGNFRAIYSADATL